MVWWMRFKYHGQQVRRSTDTSDRRLAEAILAKITVDIVEGRHFEKREEQERTFAELMDRYLKEHVRKQMSQRSVSGYTKNLLPFFQGYTLAEITPKRIVAYKAKRYADGVAPATINRRLAALRSLVKLARTLGLVPWILEVEGMRTEPYRDTRGPGHAGFRKLLEAMAGRRDTKALRDRALLRLLYDLGLRRAEVVGLDVEDLDLADGTVAVLGKGRTQKVNLTLPEATQRALAAWLAVRGVPSGPYRRREQRPTRRFTLIGSAC
jgi:site-specific recombinase XerC